MVLEDIPEMKLLVRDKIIKENIIFNFNGQNSYSAKFVELKHKQNSKNWIFAVEQVIYHLDIADYFMKMACCEYGIPVDEKNDFRVSGGGKIEIRENNIKIFSNSIRYGKYHLEIVRPIAERYFSMSMPEAKLLFE